MDNPLQPDLGDGKRDIRILNICHTLIQCWDKLTGIEVKNGDRYITKETVRSYILKETNQSVKDSGGDNRAHGDACGGHGLNLKMEGTGVKSKIFLNKSNIDKCKDYLLQHSKGIKIKKDPKEVLL